MQKLVKVFDIFYQIIFHPTLYKENYSVKVPFDTKLHSKIGLKFIDNGKTPYAFRNLFYKLFIVKSMLCIT